MEVHKIEVMPLGTNCYFAFDESTREGIVIDPGGSSDLIMKKIDELQMKVVAIVNTHGHWIMSAPTKLSLKKWEYLCLFMKMMLII